MAKPFDDQQDLNSRDTYAFVESLFVPGQVVRAVAGADGGAIPVFVSGSTTSLTPSSLQVNVATAGVAVPLAGATSQQDQIEIIANVTNTGNIFLGDSGVSSANGMIMEPGRSVHLSNVDLATIYIDSAVNGEGVSLFGLT